MNLQPNVKALPHQLTPHRLVNYRAANEYHVENELDIDELLFLSRLPSVTQRKIDVFKIAEENEVVVLKNRRGKILLLTFFKNFGDFVYVHTSIGRDKYKAFLYAELANITTKLGPTYFVVWQNAESIRVVNRIGAKPVTLSNTLEHVPNFMEDISVLTDRPYYKDGDYMYDEDDAIKEVNPIFLTTRASFLSSINAA